MANGTVAATDVRKRVRFAAALASPLGVLLTIPLLVILVGLAIILLGRSTTRDASLSMARHQLAEQAQAVQNDVAFALDQADPLLARLHVLADHDKPIDEVLVRLHDLMLGRPGIAFLSISFPDGTFRGAQLSKSGEGPARSGAGGGAQVDARTIEVQESHADAGMATWFDVTDDLLVPKRSEKTHYDPRTRGFYQLAAKGQRAWTEPYTFFKSHETGITCTEPVFDAHHVLTAVLTVDFDVGALSDFIARPALDEARSVVYTRAGAVLASPLAAALPLPTSDALLRGNDLHDPALDRLFDQPDVTGTRELATRDGAYLASVVAIGGKRAGVTVPLDWFIATVVPARTLLGPTHRLEVGGVLASMLALAIAVLVALILAWNVVRMRRQVATAREEARSAEARARELGSYRLVARLGSGGMGEVWRAEHQLLARQAAIKLIRAEMIAGRDPQAALEINERFRREAQVLASMKSRHTIAIYDYGVTEAGVFYYVMELLDGLDLESLVARFGPLPAARVIQLLVQACSSLAEAHEAGLLHRDIKPPNLFACREADEVDICKLLDFGIVQQVEDQTAVPATRASKPIIETPKLTQLGAMLGTPGFMPPEQILGMPLDGRADLYALGCVAWWLVTGGEVFPREAEANLLHKHIYEPVPSLAAAAPGWIPPELETIIAACLAKDANDRPANARALGSQLAAIRIPDEHAWTLGRARAWWRDYRAPQPAPNVPSAEVQVVMPGRTADGPAAVRSAFEQTIVGDTGR